MGENPENKHGFVWFELSGLEGVDVSSWINLDGTLNTEEMQQEITEDLEKSAERTRKWQEWAIKFSVPTD